MLSRDSFFNTSEYQNEQLFNNIIEACHRTIDWSVRLYFKTLRKSSSLFVEKVINDDKKDFCQLFTTFYLNDTEIMSLAKDIESHINDEIITVHDKWLPTVTFRHQDILPSFDFINELVNEQKDTIKLSKQVNNTICQLTTRNLSKFAPAFVPRSLSAKANCGLAKKIAQTFGVDTANHYCESKEIIEKQLDVMLDSLEHDIKDILKYQLAEQLYSWYDLFNYEPEHPQPKVVNR